MADIDHSTPVPLHYQLQLLIRRQIETGELQPGEKIPTEAELCARYNISRTPVRQALLELTREGLLTRAAGRGTFVTPKAEKLVLLNAVVPDARWQRLLQQAASMWPQIYPETNVDLAFTTVPLRDLHDYLSLVVAQGNAPDVSVLDSVWVAEFAHRRYLYPLAELDEEWADEVRRKFYPSLLAANSYQGKQYTVPTSADAAVLRYRRDWLTAEGLSPPTTWQELVLLGRHFCRPEVRGRYGLRPYPLSFAGGRAGGETTTYQLMPVLRSAGGGIIVQGQIVLNSSATHRMLSFLRTLVYEEKIVAPDVTQQPWDGPWRAFARGEVALALGGTYENFLIQSATGWSAAQFLDRVGFVPVPAFQPGGTPATLVGGMTYGIYRQSQHPREVLALLKLALTKPVLKAFSIETGQHPAYIPVAQAIHPGDDDLLAQTAPLFALGGSRPSLPAYERVSEQFQEMVESCLADRLSVEAAVRRAAERISGISGLPLASSTP